MLHCNFIFKKNLAHLHIIRNKKDIWFNFFFNLPIYSSNMEQFQCNKLSSPIDPTLRFLLNIKLVCKVLESSTDQLAWTVDMMTNVCYCFLQ